MEYDLELDRIVKEIKNSKAKTVCLQLPDGLKSKAKDIVDYIESKCKDVIVSVWLGSCFGSCDVPNIDVDLLVQFGHHEWEY